MPYVKTMDFQNLWMDDFFSSKSKMKIGHLDEIFKLKKNKTLEGWNILIMDENASKWMKI
jgi:hypothetical protein